MARIGYMASSQRPKYLVWMPMYRNITTGKTTSRSVRYRLRRNSNTAPTSAATIGAHPKPQPKLLK
jgi:hypothetical protein